MNRYPELYVTVRTSRTQPNDEISSVDEYWGWKVVFDDIIDLNQKLLNNFLHPGDLKIWMFST